MGDAGYALKPYCNPISWSLLSLKEFAKGEDKPRNKANCST